MQLFSSLLFGISASLDALLVGASLGLRKIQISLWQNLLVSSITLVGTCLSIQLGAWILPLLPASAGELFGCSILILFGLYYLIKPMFPYLKRFLSHTRAATNDEHVTNTVGQDQMALPQICILGIALSANNAGIGLSASMAGLAFLPTAAATFACSVSFLALGNLLGKRNKSALPDILADFLSGLLIIGLGIATLLF